MIYYRYKIKLRYIIYNKFIEEGVKMRRFPDAEVIRLLDEKPSNVANFRRKLKNYNLLGTRERLTQELIELFKTIQVLKREEKLDWDEAMNLGIQNYIAQKSDTDDSVPVQTVEEQILNVLHEINATLKEIKEVIK